MIVTNHRFHRGNAVVECCRWTAITTHPGWTRLARIVFAWPLLNALRRESPSPEPSNCRLVKDATAKETRSGNVVAPLAMRSEGLNVVTQRHFRRALVRSLDETANRRSSGRVTARSSPVLEVTAAASTEAFESGPLGAALRASPEETARSEDLVCGAGGGFLV